MASLLYLNHAFELSDEELFQHWAENVQWQFFSGMTYYEPRLPCDATQIGRFRAAIGEAGVEELLKATIDTAVSSKAIRPTKLEWVVVDTTVQERAIAQLQQVGSLTEVPVVRLKDVVVDLGFRGLDVHNPDVQIIHRGKFQEPAGAAAALARETPSGGAGHWHLKQDNGMDQCWLPGVTGDSLHVVLCSAGYNIRWLLRAIVSLGLWGLLVPCVCRARHAGALAWADLGVSKTGAARVGWAAL